MFNRYVVGGALLIGVCLAWKSEHPSTVYVADPAPVRLMDRPPSELTPQQAAAAALEWEAEQNKREAQEATDKKAEADKKEAADKAAAAKQAVDDSCRHNAACYVKQYWLDAEVMCGHFIEERAKYEFKWTERWGEEKFNRENTMWDNYNDAILRLSGDHLKFQNAFGAWYRVDYTCSYDTKSKLVLNVDVFDH